MKRILHISCDIGDVIEADKTTAIANLITNTRAFEHTVISLNRTANPFDVGEVHYADGSLSLRYFGLPGGIGLRYSLSRVASRLVRLLKERAMSADIVHCHKLTFEGPIGRRIATALGCPYVCTVRGDTDLKLLRFKPTYRNWYRSILRASSAAFFVAPWTQRILAQRWPDSLPARRALLPNIVELPAPDIDRAENSDRIVTAFHLKDYRRKNLGRLMDAVDECWESWQPVRLDIIGGGDPTVVGKVEAMIERQQHPEAFRLLGHLSRDEIATAFPGYAALVLPSRRETFGMVYLEALLCGIPFVQSENTGLDGYFDDDDVSVRVDPGSARAIAAGIRYVLENSERLRANVRALQQNGGLERFSCDVIVRTYTDTIAQSLGNS